MKYLHSILDMALILEKLHTCMPDFSKHFKRVNESNIACIETIRLRPYVLSFLKRKAVKREVRVEIERRMMRQEQ